MEGLIQLTCLPTSSQLADVCTKILPSSMFQALLHKLGMVNTPPNLRGDVNTHAYALHVTAASSHLVSLTF